MKEAFQNCVYMGKGVTVDETVGINGSVLLEDDVSIAKNSQIGPYVVLKKGVMVGENSIVENAAIFEKAKLDSFCKVHRSIVAEHAVLRSRVTLEGSVVGHGCILGKSAHLKNGRGVWPGITVEEGNIIEGKLALHMDELFHFYSSLGQYTGFSAKNIRDMINLTRKVGLKSIKFHLYRRDIECWIRDVCKANILAGMILDLRKDRLLGKKLVEELTRRLDDWLI